MKLPEISVRRPVTTLMVFLAFLLMGAVSLSMLSVDQMPDIELPSISVITNYPGASAEDVESKVTEYIEENLAITSGLDEINSVSKDNISVVTLTFDWDVDINEASNDVRDNLEMAKRDLPDDAEDPVIFKINTSMMPIMVLGVSADENYQGLNFLVEKNISDPLKTVPGVGTAQIIGGPRREISIRIDPERLEAYGLSFQRIGQVLASENVTLPAGSIDIGKNEYQVRVPGEYTSADEVVSTVVGVHRGRLVHLHDVATVEDGFEEQDVMTRVNGKDGLVLLIQKQSGANTVEVAEAVKQELDRIMPTLPADLEYAIVTDSSTDILSSLDNLTEAVIVGGILVIIVVIIFLRHFRDSLIISLAIPFSLIISFLFLYLLDYTINMVSLMSLSIAVGMVIDDAVVVFENIVRHVEEGEPRAQASVFGASEVGLAVMASTLSTVAVFVPMMFVTGIIGVIFKQLALVVSITILASLFCSLTLIPMLSSRLLRQERSAGGSRRLASRFFQASERVFEAIDNAYSSLLGWAVRHKLITAGVAVLLLATCIPLVGIMGTDYFPHQDTGDVGITVELPTGTRMEESDRISLMLEKIVKENVPEMRDYYVRLGQSEEGFATMLGQKEGANIIDFGMKLVDHEQRSRSSFEVGEALRPLLDELPGVRSYEISTASMLTTVLGGGGRPLSLDITGYDLEKARQLSAELQEILRSTPGAVDVSDNFPEERAELEVKVDREKAAALGLNTGMVASALRSGIYGYNPTDFKEAGDEFDIFMRLREQDRKTIRDLEDVPVTTFEGDQVRVGNVAVVEQGFSPIEIRRRDQQRIITVGADVYGRSLGDVAGEVRGKMAGLEVPQEMNVSFGGDVEEQAETFRDLGLMLLLGIIIVYMVMASQFESLREPFIIMFSIPFAFVGVIWAFMLTGVSLNVMSFIGVIMLMGIVVKNAIVLIDYMNILRARGLELTEAVTLAGRRRLRPVLMTSLTTIFGMLPLALSTGQGSEMWRPMGITVIGGLSISLLVTLVLIPVIYHLFEQRSIRRKGGLT